MKALLCILFLLAMNGSALAASYTLFGQYYGNSKGSTDEFVYWPNNSGTYIRALNWGYDIWNQGSETVPAPGWIVSQDLRQPPYNVPANATAVRIHVKAKVAGLTYATEEMHAAVQIKFRKHGSTDELNEMIHSTIEKHANLPTVTPYDLNHVEVDIPIGPDGKIEMYRYPAITGRMLISVATFLAGYWAPYTPPE